MSAIIAEQTRYRQALLKALQPYESHIAFIERLAYWDSPPHTVGAAIVFTIALNMFVNLVTKTTLVTFAAVIFGTLLIGWRISQTVRINFTGTPTRGSLDTLVYHIVSLRFGTQRFVHHTVERLQSPDSTRYLIKLGAFLLIVAFVGSFFHLSTLIWLAVLGLLVIPGATQRGLHQMVWVHAAPHFNANWPKVAPFITPAAAIASDELRKILALDLAVPVSSPSSSSSSSSSSAAAPAVTEKSAPSTVSTSTQTTNDSEDDKDWVRMSEKTD